MRLSARGLATFLAVVIVFAVWLGYYFTSGKLESTRKGMENLLKNQQIEIKNLESALDAEKEVRQNEFEAAAKAREANKKFQDQALKSIDDMVAAIKENATAQAQDVRETGKRILGEIETTRKSAVATKNEAIQTQIKVNRLRKEKAAPRPFIKIF
jgi:hypothetical protein